MNAVFLVLLTLYVTRALVANRRRDADDATSPPEGERSSRGVDVPFFDLGPLWQFVVDNPATLLRFVGVSAGEELIYRAVAQPLLIAYTGSPVLGILIVAAVFSSVHRHFFRNPLGQSGEFIGFAIAVGVLYYWTGSLILVVVIHAVRNIEIAYLEHVLEIEKTDGQFRRVRFIDVLQTTLFGIACYLAAREGVFSRGLVSPVYFGAGLIAGHLIFGVSLLVTHLSCAHRDSECS